MGSVDCYEIFTSSRRAAFDFMFGDNSWVAILVKWRKERWMDGKSRQRNEGCYLASFSRRAVFVVAIGDDFIGFSLLATSSCRIHSFIWLPFVTLSTVVKFSPTVIVGCADYDANLVHKSSAGGRTFYPEAGKHTQLLRPSNKVQYPTLWETHLRKLNCYCGATVGSSNLKWLLLIR